MSKVKDAPLFLVRKDINSVTGTVDLILPDGRGIRVPNRHGSPITGSESAVRLATDLANGVKRLSMNNLDLPVFVVEIK